MEPSDSSESNSVVLITLFKNPILDFHSVISALMTPINYYVSNSDSVTSDRQALSHCGIVTTAPKNQNVLQF